MNENRTPAGTPTGGQFATSAKGEATGVALSDPPTPLTDALGDRGYLLIKEHEFDGDYGFDHVVVQSDGAGGFLAYPTVEEDMTEGLAQFITSVRGDVDYDTAHEAAQRWLTTNGEDVINAHLRDAYSATNDDTRDWDMAQSLSCEARLGADATTADVLAECEDTQAMNLTDDLASGAFYSDVLEIAALRAAGKRGNHTDQARIDSMVRDQVGKIVAALAEETPKVEFARTRIADVRDAVARGTRRGVSASKPYPDVTVGYQDFDTKDADGMTKPFGAAGSIEVTTHKVHRGFEFGTADGYPDYDSACEAAAAFIADSTD